MRKITLLEPLLTFGLIVAYIWKLRFVYPSCWIVIPVLMLLSHLVRRERPRALGFRVDNLTYRLKEFTPLLVAIILVLLAGGALFHTFRKIDFDGVVLSLAAYLPWGLAQEYALNGYFLNRFDAAISRRAASILTAALFCAAHAPNYFLMAVTFPLALCATLVYRRTRNLYVLGIAHAIIGLMLFLVVPDSVSHHLRVGPGFFHFHDVHLRGSGAVAGEGDLGFVGGPGRMRMGPLRAVDGIGGGFHPAQLVSGARKILGQGVARVAPLRTLVARFAEAELTTRSGGHVDDLQTFIGMIGVAEDALAATVGRDVPGVVVHDRADFAGGPVHAAQDARPNREYEIATVAKEGLMNQKLVVPVLVEAFEAAAVASDAVHARGRIARELDPFGFERMELGRNDGARKRNRMPAGFVEASGDEAALSAGFKRGGEPFAIAADGAFA